VGLGGGAGAENGRVRDNSTNNSTNNSNSTFDERIYSCADFDPGPPPLEINLPPSKNTILLESVAPVMEDGVATNGTGGASGMGDGTGNGTGSSNTAGGGQGTKEGSGRKGAEGATEVGKVGKGKDAGNTQTGGVEAKGPSFLPPRGQDKTYDNILREAKRLLLGNMFWAMTAFVLVALFHLILVYFLTEGRCALSCVKGWSKYVRKYLAYPKLELWMIIATFSGLTYSVMEFGFLIPSSGGSGNSNSSNGNAGGGNAGTLALFVIMCLFLAALLIFVPWMLMRQVRRHAVCDARSSRSWEDAEPGSGFVNRYGTCT
jgi:hypothetical protein